MTESRQPLPDLGPFKPLEALGEGGTGTVYLAQFPDSDREVAVKLLRADVASDEQAMERFLEVTRALKGLGHPHVAELIGARRMGPDRVLVVMEYVPGRDLGDALSEREVLDQAEVIRLARQLCQGLAAAHARGVLHLDLKPENVLLTRGADGGPRVAKIVDFGMAQLRRPDAVAGGVLRDAAGQLLGTPEYWSPEQACGAPVDARSDLYSLGVLLYEVLSGATPFSSHSVSDVISQHVRVEPGPISRPPGSPTVTPDLEALVLRCLAKEPGDRFADALQLDAELARLEQHASPDAAGDAAPATETRRAAPRDPLVGELLGKYRITGLLGEGGMGKVYEAEHTLLGRRVAVKMLRREYAANPAAVQRFFREARAVNRIAHPNIIEVTDFVQEEGGDNYYIMELLQGQSLDQLIGREKGLPPDRIVALGQQICSALSATHAAGIIHRDLKPENIYLEQQNERGHPGEFIKLLDFGVAKLLDHDGTSVQTTKAGAILGTPEYMSPEQAASKTIDARTDVYALGVILYEMATGRPPFESQGVAELLVMHLTVEPRAPSTREPRFPLPPALERVILRCLAKEPEDRYQDMAELEAALGATLDRTEAIAPRSAGSTAEDRPWWRRRPLLALAITIAPVLLLGVWLGLLLADNGEPPPAAPAAAPAPGPPPAPARPSAAAPPSAPAARPAPAAPSGPPAARTAARTRAKTTAAPAKTARPRRRPSQVRIAFSSLPKGAAVYRDGRSKPLGHTPFTTRLKYSRKPASFVFRLAGYEPVEKQVTLRRDGQVQAILKGIRVAPPKRSKKVKQRKKQEPRKRKGTSDPF